MAQASTGKDQEFSGALVGVACIAFALASRARSRASWRFFLAEGDQDATAAAEAVLGRAMDAGGALARMARITAEIWSGVGVGWFMGRKGGAVGVKCQRKGGAGIGPAPPGVVSMSSCLSSVQGCA